MKKLEEMGTMNQSEANAASGGLRGGHGAVRAGGIHAGRGFRAGAWAGHHRRHWGGGYSYYADAFAGCAAYGACPPPYCGGGYPIQAPWAV